MRGKEKGRRLRKRRKWNGENAVEGEGVWMKGTLGRTEIKISGGRKRENKKATKEGGGGKARAR